MEKTLFSLKKYKKELIIGPIFKTFEVIFELLIPFLMKYMINEGIPFAQQTNNIEKILYPGLIIVVLSILGFLSTLVCQYLASIASQGVGTDLRNRIFKKVNSLSIKEIEDFGRGNLVNLVTNDTNRVQQGVAMLIRLAIRAPILVIGSLICSFIIDYRIGLMFLSLIPIISLILFFILKANSKNYLKVQSILDDVSSFTKDSLKGIRVNKALNKQNEVEESYSKKARNFYSESKRANIIAALINPLTFLVINIGILLVIYFGGNFVLSNELSDGDLVALISYLNQILMALVVMSNLVIIFTKAITSTKRIDSLLIKESSIINSKKYNHLKIKNGGNLFEFKDVDFAYNSTKYALKNLNFTIKKGEKIGIIGSTGSGKSTIVKLLERYYDVTSGALLYKGFDIKDYDIDSLRDEISLVSQKSVLFNGTIKSNMLISKDNASDIEIIDALKKSEAFSFVEKYEDSIDHEVLEGGKNFSGGQKQRLSIARALLKDSEVLILDDSTSALDYLTDSKIRQRLFADEDKTIILISQRSSSLQNCDKIIVLENGKIDGIGTHEELLKTSSVYVEIYNSQKGQ
ncbi:MAG: ABC transporter ATP-binding protein [Candidatus Onthovivens sp.]|nr:ABC transporter ATP-binding protein [Candidatus Onthovivens sp.]